MSILYQQRSFSDKFNVAFEWVRQNYKSYLKYVTIFLLPVSLFQAFGVNSMLMLSVNDIQGNADSVDGGMMLSLGAYYLFSMIGGLLSAALSMSLIERTLIKGGSIQGMTAGEVWQGIKTKLGRLLLGGIVLGILFSIFMVIVAVLAYASLYTLILTIPAMVYLAFAITPFLPIYLFTDEPLFEAVGHGLRLGTKCWGGFAGTLMVMSILMQIVGTFGASPVMIVMAVQAIFGQTATGLAGTVMDFVGYLTSVGYCYVIYVLQILMMLILCIQYGHASDKIDGSSIDEEVETF